MAHKDGERRGVGGSDRLRIRRSGLHQQQHCRCKSANEWQADLRHESPFALITSIHCLQAEISTTIVIVPEFRSADNLAHHCKQPSSLGFALGRNQIPPGSVSNLLILLASDTKFSPPS